MVANSREHLTIVDACSLNNACLLQLRLHLLLQLQRFLPGFFREVSAARSIDNSSGTIDKEPTITVHPIPAYVGQRASLGPNSRNQQKVVGRMFSDLDKGVAPCGSNNKHGVFYRSPVADLIQDIFE